MELAIASSNTCFHDPVNVDAYDSLGHAYRHSAGSTTPLPHSAKC
jgi:hypothetical protein